MKIFFITVLSLSAFFVKGDYWLQKNDFVGGNTHIDGSFNIGNKGYIVSGVDTWEYDPVSDTWIQKSSCPCGWRVGHLCFSVLNKGYLGLGRMAFDTTNFYDFWEFDPIINSWTPKASFPGIGREYASGFGIDSIGYVGGGDHYYHLGGWTSLYDFWKYNPSNDTWLQDVNLQPSGRSGFTVFTIGEKGYVGLGFLNTSLYNDFWVFNSTTDSWSQLANFGGGARWFAVGFSINSKGYIGLGQGNLGMQPDFWEYDTTTNTWNQKADFGGIGRVMAAGFSIGNKGYIGMGAYIPPSNERDTSDFWEYTPDTITSVNNLSIHSLQVSIYPIPAHGFINITLSKIINGQIKIYNTEGAPVFTSTINGISKKINFDLNPGVYYLMLTSGKNISTKRIIVE